MERWLHSLLIVFYVMALAVGGLAAGQPAAAHASQIRAQDEGHGTHQNDAHGQGDRCCIQACYSVPVLQPASQKGVEIPMRGSIGYQPVHTPLVGRSIRPEPTPPRQIFLS